MESNKQFKKSSAPNLKDLDVQQRRLAILKQKQCDKIALNIVSKLIDGRVDEQVFLQSLKYINQCHFQDIIDERIISNLCGYPVCANIIPQMPKQKYHISTKLNKVYDITDRKNFCSNFCYKAATFIKNQMLTSPLWFRDKEKIPEFNLLPKTDPGLLGEEINLGILNFKKDEDFTPVSQLAQDSINEISNTKCVDSKIEQINKDNTISNFLTPSLADILKENSEYFDSENSKSNDEDKSENISFKFDKTIINNKISENEKLGKSILKKSVMKNLNQKRVSFSNESPQEKLIEKVGKRENSKLKNINLIGDVQEKPTFYNFPKNENCTNSSNISKNSSLFKKSKKSGPVRQINTIFDIKSRFKEWSTIDTILFLFDEQKIKEVISEKKLEYVLKKKRNLGISDKNEKRLENIIKRLNLMEILDNKYDESVTGKSEQKLPVPHFEELREKAEMMDLRVKAFYSGCYEVVEEEYETVEDEEEKNDLMGPPAVLPLVDSKDFHATRKKIFLNSLSRMIPEICEILKQSPNKLLSELNELINTFEFTAKNIVFKTNEWRFVAVFLIKVLAIRNTELENSLKEREVCLYINALEKEFNLNFQLENLLEMCIEKSDFK